MYVMHLGYAMLMYMACAVNICGVCGVNVVAHLFVPTSTLNTYLRTAYLTIATLNPKPYTLTQAI